AGCRLGVALLCLGTWSCGEQDSGSGSGSGGSGPGSGGAATGGQTGSGGGATGGGNGDGDGGPTLPPLPDGDTTPAPERENFTLLFEDHFDTLDTSRWQTASHTFTENAAQFDPSMVTIEDG